MRLSRGGNRRINTALHMAALTQIRLGKEGSAYYDKLIARGKTKTEALRLLRRRLSDRVFSAMRAGESRGIHAVTARPGSEATVAGPTITELRSAA